MRLVGPWVWLALRVGPADRVQIETCHFDRDLYHDHRIGLFHDLDVDRAQSLLGSHLDLDYRADLVLDRLCCHDYLDCPVCYTSFGDLVLDLAWGQ